MWITLAKTEHREAKFLSKGRILEPSNKSRGQITTLGCASGGRLTYRINQSRPMFELETRHYCFGITISSPNIEGLCVPHTIPKIPTLSAVKVTR